MTTTEIPARDFTWSINTGTVASPTWVAIEAQDTWDHKPSSSDADTTVFDDDGRESHMKIARGDEFTLKGKYREDPDDDGALPPSHEAMEAHGAGIGIASRKQWKYVTPGGVTKKFLATAQYTCTGGGNNDIAKWECALKVSGSITTVPAA